jgi:SAM-dependent methyltransferase
VSVAQAPLEGGRCVCGERRHEIVMSALYQRLADPNYEFAILKCTACGLGRTSPVPDPLQYSAGYSLSTENGEFVGSTADLWSANIARDVRRRATGKRLIDIGCHVGNLVEAASAIGFEAYGIDVDPVAIAAGQRLGRAVENRTLAQVNRTFDVAVMNHVVEHVLNLDSFLFHLERILVPRGLAFIYVPHYRGLIPRLMRENWIGWFPQAHVWHFTPATLTTTVERAGSLRVVGCTTRGVIEPPSTGIKGVAKAAISAFSRRVAWGDEVEAVFERNEWLPLHGSASESAARRFRVPPAQR